MTAAPVIVERRRLDPVHRHDPVRPGHRVELEVDVMPAATSMPGIAGRIKHGVQRVVIHHEDLATVEALVEDRMEMWTVAEEQVRRKRREWVQRNVPRETMVPEDESLWSDEMHKLGERFTGITVPGAFRELVGRDRRPLRSLTVTNARVDPEVSYEARMAADTAMLLQGQGSAELGAAMDLIREQSEAIADLRQQVADLRKPSSSSGSRKS